MEGSLSRINTDPIKWAMRSGHIPVLQSIGESPRGQLINLDVSQVTAAISSGLQPRKVIFVNATGGIQDDKGEVGTYCLSLPWPSPYLVLVYSSFHSPCSPVLCFLSLYSFTLNVFSYNIAPSQFWSSYLSSPPTSIFHVLITTSSSVVLSTCSNHLSLASLILAFMFVAPALAHISSFPIFSILFIPIIHLDILICSF